MGEEEEMMDGLSGNPYGYPSEIADDTQVRMANDGMLALAYEQRTANLIAMLDVRLRSGTGGTTDLEWRIGQRLGLVELRPQCPAKESGGYQCERSAGHDGAHWISDETIGRA